MNIEELRNIRHIFIESCPSLPKPQDVEFWSSTRKKRVKNLCEMYGAENLKNLIFDKVEKSDFLTNRSGKWAGCSFDWIIKPENVQKIAEGNYDNRASSGGYENPNRSYDIEKAIIEAEDDQLVYIKNAKRRLERKNEKKARNSG